MIIIPVFSTNATLPAGTYNLVAKEALSSSFTDEEIVTYPFSESVLFQRSLGGKLNIDSNGKLYLIISSSFDTGNTLAKDLGDYEVELDAINENVYQGKNELIDLTATIKNSNQLELLIKSRVVHLFINTYSVSKNSYNIMLNVPTLYLFERQEQFENITSQSSAITDYTGEQVHLVESITQVHLAESVAKMGLIMVAII